MSITKDAPIWHKVRDSLLERIDSGELTPQQRLPSEKDLCRAFGVSQITIRRALRELAEAGRIKRRQGVGTFVAESPQAGPSLETDTGSRSLLDVGLVFNYDRVQRQHDMGGIHLAIFTELEGEVTRRGGRLQLLSHPQESTDPSSLEQTARQHGLGALALVGMFHAALFPQLVTPSLTVVHVDYAPDDSPLDAIVLDHADGARQALEILWALGHRRFGMLRARKDDPERPGAVVETPSSRGRYQGFQAGLHALGGEGVPPVSGQFGTYEWVADLERVLTADRPPTALLLSDPFFLPETVRLAERLGRPVPEKLSVIVFGAPEALPGFRPRPTVATFNPAVMAAMVADRIAARVACPQAGRVIRLVPMRIAAGDSASPAPRE